MREVQVVENVKRHGVSVATKYSKHQLTWVLRMPADMHIHQKFNQPASWINLDDFFITEEPQYAL